MDEMPLVALSKRSQPAPISCSVSSRDSPGEKSTARPALASLEPDVIEGLFPLRTSAMIVPGSGPGLHGAREPYCIEGPPGARSDCGPVGSLATKLFT